MGEGELRFEEVFGEIRAVMLSVPCPNCGFVPKRVVGWGEVVNCESCGYPYTVEKCLTEAGRETIRRIVENVLGRFQVFVQDEIGGSVAVFEEYANAVLEELRRCYKSQGCLPSREELDRMLSTHTESVLNSILRAAETLRGDHQQIKWEVVKVGKRLESISVNLKDFMSFLKKIFRIPEGGKTTAVPHIPPPREFSLTYFDFEGKECSINIDEYGLRNGVILGREACPGWPIKLEICGENRILGIGDSTVSRTHAKIICHDGEIFIEDLNSKSGTYVNGQKIEPGKRAKLKNGYQVRIGLGTTFKIKM
jgi:hypothetical protein